MSEEDERGSGHLVRVTDWSQLAAPSRRGPSELFPAGQGLCPANPRHLLGSSRLCRPIVPCSPALHPTSVGVHI